MVRGLPPSIRAIVQTLWLTGGDGLALSGGRASMSAAMGWSARAGVCLVVAAALTACAGVTRSGGDYRLKAQKTVTDLTAVVGSAQLAGRQYLAGRLPQETARVSERLREIKSLEGGLTAGVKEAVGGVAGVWEQVVEQLHNALVGSANSSSEDEK